MCRMDVPQFKRTWKTVDGKRVFTRAPLKTRLLEKTTVSASGCWVFCGRIRPDGYGQINPGGRSGQMMLAHRASWEVHFGAIPDGMSVCHRCDNPPCVNPDHLFVGSHAENMRDRNRKGRVSRGKKTRHFSGPELTSIRIRYLSGESCAAIARSLSRRPCVIQNIVHGRTYSGR